MSHLKNKVTGEIKEVLAGSEEYMKLAAERIVGVKGAEDQPHRPLWEDRGVAAHAELGLDPAVGNINDTSRYDDEAPAEDSGDELLAGSDREVHSKASHAFHDGESESSGQQSAADKARATTPPAGKTS